MESLQERVVRLELQLRRMRRLMLVGLVGVAGAAVAGLGPGNATFNTIRAHEIIVGREGRPQVRIGRQSPTGIGLSVVDGKTDAAIKLGLADGQPSVQLQDSGGTPRIAMTTNRQGQAELRFSGTEGRLGCLLQHRPDAGGRTAIYDRDGQIAVLSSGDRAYRAGPTTADRDRNVADWHDTGAGITLFDAEGRMPRCLLKVDHEGNGCVRVAGPGGAARLIHPEVPLVDRRHRPAPGRLDRSPRVGQNPPVGQNPSEGQRPSVLPPPIDWKKYLKSGQKDESTEEDG